MKKKILIPILGWSLQTAAQQTFTPVIIGFYNIENFYDTLFHGRYDDASFTPNGSKAYTSAVFKEKTVRLATVISRIGIDSSPDGPAILGIAETENSAVLDALVRHPLLKKRHYEYVHYNSKDARGQDVALLYNPRYFKVLKSKPIFVKLPEGSKDGTFTRDILWVKGLLDGEELNVLVNHWPSRFGGEKRSEPGRMAAAITVRKFIDSLSAAAPGSRCIVMGDLNDDPVNNSITAGLRAKGDIKALQSGDLYNPWIGFYKKGNGTLAYQNAWSLFDQIIISPAFLNKEQDGFFFHRNYIFKRDFMIENMGAYKGYPLRSYTGDTYRGGYSDHFPVYMVLIKKTPQ